MLKFCQRLKFEICNFFESNFPFLNHKNYEKGWGFRGFFKVSTRRSSLFLSCDGESPLPSLITLKLQGVFVYVTYKTQFRLKILKIRILNFFENVKNFCIYCKRFNVCGKFAIIWTEFIHNLLFQKWDFSFFVSLNFLEFHFSIRWTSFFKLSP